VDDDVTPPATPRGVASITGDEYVEILWFESDESDLAGYRVWRNTAGYDEPYDLLAEITVSPNSNEGYYFDDDVHNRVTYWYAVSAFDHHGNESDLSPENAFDTPRSAGYDLVLYDAQYRANLSGYDFSGFRHEPYTSSYADIVADYDEELGVFFIDVGNVNTDIQDFGYTDDLDVVDWAPAEGWSNVGWVEVILGHSYIVWTQDNHYAKFRVTGINTNSIMIDWAYQEVQGNPELKPSVRSAGYLRPAARNLGGQ